jgi:hypothetical protein
MNEGTTKRGFIPPQPAAALSALDFAHASEALRRAHEAASVVQGEVATDTVAEVIAQCADRLIGIPTTNPAHIAEKVTAYAWLHNVSPNLSDQATQWRIAEGDDDAAKGLLAIYLDLMKLASPAVDPELVRLMDVARVAYDAFEKDCDTFSDEVKAEQEGRTLTKADARQYRKLSDARSRAINAVLAYPAATPAEALAKAEFCNELMTDDGTDLAQQLNAVWSDVARWAGEGQ